MEKIREVSGTIEAFKVIGEAVQVIGKTAIELKNFKETINEKITNLQGELTKLGNRKEDVVAKLREEEHSRRKRKREVDDWLRNVDIKMGEASDRLRTVRASGNFSRWQLRGPVQKDVEELTELDKQGREFKNDLCTDAVLCRGVKSRVPSLLQSQQRESDTIWEFLKGDRISKIGVCGMAGVGKTTIAYVINNKLLADDSFDDVYWVCVPRKSSTYKLQNLIANAAGLALRKEETWKRASMLHEWLLSKRFVLILDDIRESFPLEEVGIPLDNKERKLLLTTCRNCVCLTMDCELIQVKPLFPEESWELFVKELGSTGVQPQYEEHAKSVAESCDNVALTIKTLARSMRRRRKTSEWRYASWKLKTSLSHSRCEFGDMPNRLFEQLKFSYDNLDNENLRHCLLYCALFPKGREIERNELIAYWIGEKLICKEERISEAMKRKEEFDIGKDIIRCLTDACFLETRKHMNGRSFIKMHDAVWKMALNVAKLEKYKFMVKAGVNLKEFPIEKDWLEDLSRVSLMRNDFEKCNIKSPHCPDLKTLLLQHNEKLRYITHSFFREFQSLYVLDLSHSSIKLLPNTIIDLEELRVLILRSCNCLTSVPSLRGKLKNLSELDLGFTGLRKIPTGIESLENLRVLDLSWTCLGTLITSTVLRRLTLLQSLRLGGCQVQQEAVTRLQRLETLHMDFSNIQSFTSYLETLHWEKVQQYCIVCRTSENPARIDAPYENLRTVILSIGSEWESTGSLLLPANMQQLQIDSCSNVTGLLRHLQLQPFDNLRCLTFTRCQQEMHLFSSELAEDVLPRLRDLKLLQVCDCSHLEEIFYQYDHPRVALPRRLVLRHLPKLKSIYSGIIHSIEEIEVVGCPELKRLPLSMNDQVGGEAGHHSLKKVRGQREWWDSLLWDTPDLRGFMKEFFCESNV